MILIPDMILFSPPNAYPCSCLSSQKHKDLASYEERFFLGGTCSARLEHNPLRVMRMRKMFSVVFPTFPSCHVLNLSDISKTKPGCNYTHYSMQPTSVTMRQKKLTWEQDALTVPVISFTDLKTNHTHAHALHCTSSPASEQFTTLVESDSTFLVLPWWVSSTGVSSSSMTSKQCEIKIRHSAGAVQWSEKPVYPHRVACCLYAALAELLHLTVRVEWIGTRPAFTASQGPLFSKPRSNTLKDTVLGFLSIFVYTSLFLCPCLQLFFPPLLHPFTFPPSPLSFLTLLPQHPLRIAAWPMCTLEPANGFHKIKSLRAPASESIRAWLREIVKKGQIGFPILRASSQPLKPNLKH